MRSTRKRIALGRRLFAQQLEDRRLLAAGPYAPAAGQIGSTAIAENDTSIVAWATGLESYTAGSNLDAEFRIAGNALGPAEGDTVSLGRGGEITLSFDDPIRDGIGPDFAVFENGFSDTFLELGVVEVSSDGVNFFRFASDSLTPNVVDAFGEVDPTDVHNLAGKYRQGFGTPFDLEELLGVSELLNIASVTHVRLLDVVGDGSQKDSSGDPIFDPFPTTGSAGLDIDAVGVIHQAGFARDIVGFEDVGATLAAGSAFKGPVPNGRTVVGPFDDNVVVGSFQSETLSFNNALSTDFGSWTGWAYSNGTNTTTPGFGNQFSSFAGGGASGSRTFGVGFPDQSNFFGPSVITRDSSDMRRFESMKVTNTTYAAISMRDGDAFAKKFGGASGNDPDFLRLTITGKNASDVSVGSIQFYLADYRFANNALDYIVDEWIEVDLRPLAGARSLEFSITSSDVGSFGINTPAYFAADDITLTKPELLIDIADREVVESDGAGATMVRISRAGSVNTAALDVSIGLVNSDTAVVPTSVTIPAGKQFVEFPVGVVDNNVVDGDRMVVIEASAPGFVAANDTLTIQDDDVRSLVLTIDETSIDEGSSRVATVSRNDADLSTPLTVQIESSKSSLLSFNEIVTIGRGRASSTFTITAIEDQFDRPNTQLSMLVSATNYIDGFASLNVIDNDEPTVMIEVDPVNYSESEAASSARLEDVGKRLAPESFYNGADQAGGFSSEGISFNNDFDPMFGSWSGWSYSNVTDTTTAGFSNQYSAFTGVGAGESDTYGVATIFTLPTITRDPITSDGFQSIAVTNTTYAALSMMRGDAFAKKFGGGSGDDADFFLLTIEGFDSTDTSVGMIDFYLADFRFADNSLDYIVDQWMAVDVSGLSNAVELRFSLTSSDVGSFGMNTPAYFAVDNVVLANQTAQPMVTIRRNTFDLSTKLDVAISSDDLTEAVLPPTATIPAGADSVAVPLTIIDDAIVDGDQTVMLSVEADSHVSSIIPVTIQDDDVATLSLSILTSTLGEADGQGRAVLHRNIADTDLSLTVDLSVELENQLTIPQRVTIPAGQRSVQFTFTPQDNAIADQDRMVSVEASADGFSSGQDVVLIVNDDVAPPTLTLELDRETLSESDAPPTITLEDIGATLPGESFNNGADLSGGFDSGHVRLNNTFDTTFGSWGGWSISNTTDSTTPGFQNQYSAITALGANGSATYAVAGAFPGGTLATISIDNPQDDSSFQSLMVTNTTYAALSMAEGDAFAKKFGGETGDDPDFFLLTIEGRDQNDMSVGTVEFYLADFRFDDNSQDVIVDQWTVVDVTSLTAATRLEFSLSSSDNGQFGMNTPAYFAVDNILLKDVDSRVANATVTRNDADLSAQVVVSLNTDDSTEATLPQSVVIPSGSASATFAIRSVDDAVVDGSRVVEITASSTTHAESSASLVVQDNDLPTLTLSLSNQAVSETAGAAATQLLVHRNTQDVTSPLAIQLSATLSDIEVPAMVTIPEGAVSLVVQLGTIDNVIHDGQRVVSIEASADGFVSSSVALSVEDDEVAGFVVTESDGVTTVSELLGQDDFEVSLSAQPLSDVFVDIVASSDDVVLDVTRLTFTPQQWSQPHVIAVAGILDLESEGDEVVTVTVSVDADVSDPSFAPAGDATIEVVVEDHQPTRLRLGDDDATIFLVDEDAGIPIFSGAHRDGIQVVANDLPQTLLVDPLTLTRGIVQVDLLGGDDTMIVRGSRFTSLAGGDGYDQLILRLDVSVELVDFMDLRVLGFEEVVVDNDLGTELTIDGPQLERIRPDGGTVLIRTDADQRLKFIGSGAIDEPIMIRGDFAQVIRFGQTRVHVISDAPWQNVLSKWDVNHSGDVTSLDALAVVNQLARMTDSTLPPLTSIEQFSGTYFDVSGDGRMTSLDALRVINEVARRQLSTEGEAIFLGILPTPWVGNDKQENELNREREFEILVDSSPAVAVKQTATTVAFTSRDEAIRQLYSGDADESEPLRDINSHAIKFLV